MIGHKYNFTIPLLLISILLLIWSNYIFQKNTNQAQTIVPNSNQNSSQQKNQEQKNKIILHLSVPLEIFELSQLLDSVDEFMNEYKLPKGVENTYNVFIEKKLNDSLEIKINPEDPWNSEKRWTVYANKINGVWRVNPQSGPWCNLITFENKECLPGEH